MMRETMSVPPPAPKPTSTRIGRSFGHSAEAGAAKAVSMPAASAATINVRFIVFPPAFRAALALLFS